MSPKKTKRNKENTHINSQSVTSSLLSESKAQGSYIMLILIALALMLPLFFRGSFFPAEQHLSQLAIMMLFLGWMFRGTLQSSRLTAADQPWSLILVMLVISYSLPIVTFQWANLDQAIGSVLWYLTLLLVYWLVRENITNKGMAPLLMDLWIIAGFIVATIGLGSLAGYGGLADAVLGGNRIASIFQYPNTLAAFLMGLFFVTTGRMLTASTLKRKAIYAGAGWWMMLVFILTYSRAAWLIFPIMAIVYWVLIPREDKLPLLFYDTITAVTLIIALQPIVRLTPGPEETEPRMLLIALVGLGVAVLLFVVVQKALDILRNSFEIVAYGVFALAAVLGISFMVMAYNVTEPLHFENRGEEIRSQSLRRTVENFYPGDYQLNLHLDAQGGDEGQWPWLVRVDTIDETDERKILFQYAAQPDDTGEFSFLIQVPEKTTGLIIFFQNRFPDTSVTFNEASIEATESDWSYEIPLSYKYVPEALVARFEAINLDEGGASTRIAYYRDGIKMFLAHPITGMGGGAWEQAYRQFQTEPYTSRQTHNYYLQVLLEAGIIGIITILAFIALLLLGLYQTFRRGNNLGISVYIGLLAALGHSALDFNFSFFSFALFIWSLVALLPPLEKVQGLNHIMSKVNHRQIPSLVLLLLMLPILFVTGLRYSAMGQGATASAAAAQGDIEATYYFLDSAIGRNPFHPLYRSDMVQLLTAAVQQSGQVELLQEAKEHLSSGIRYAPHHDSLMRQSISLYASLRDTDQVIALTEERASKMPMLVQMYESNIEILNNYTRSWLQDNTQESRDEAQRILLWNMTHIERFTSANELAERHMIATDKLRTAINETQALEYALENGIESNHIRDGFIFASFPILEYQLGMERLWRIWNSEEGKVVTELTEDGLKGTNEGTSNGFVFTPDLPLEPSTTYGVLISFKEVTLVEPLHMHVIAVDSAEKRTQYTHIHDPEEGMDIAFDFTTTSEIDPANEQYVRWDHPGNDDGSFIIKGISIYSIKPENQNQSFNMKESAL